MTEKLKSELKYKEFLEWGKVNGVVMPSIDYPVAFGNEGLIGGAAKCDIWPNKAFLFVPSSILITLETARDSEIGIIIKENNTIFQEFHDGEYLTLAFFLMYELLKGIIIRKKFLLVSLFSNHNNVRYDLLLGKG